MSTFSIEEVRKDIDGTNEEHRFSAWLTLYSASEPEAIAEVEEIITGNDPIKKILFSRFLGNIHEEKADYYLSLLLCDDNIDVFKEARKAFDKNPNPNKLDLLYPLIEHPKRHVQFFAIESLSTHHKYNILDRLIPLLREADDELKVVILRAFEKMPSPTVIQYTWRLLNSSNEEIRFRALLVFYALSEINALPTQKIFLDMLNDLSPRVRQTALWSIRNNPPKSYLKFIYDLLHKDSDPIIRKLCVRLLSHYKTVKTVDHLFKVAVNEKTIIVRLKAESTLSSMPYSLLRKSFSKYLNHKDEKIRHKAILLLAAQRKRDLEHFNYMLSNIPKNLDIKDSVIFIEALGIIGHINGIPILEKYLYDNSPLLSYTAATALTKIYDIDNVPNVINILKNDKINNQIKQAIFIFLKRKSNPDYYSEGLIATILPYLHHENQIIRYISAECFFNVSNEEIIPQLFKALIAENHHSNKEILEDVIISILRNHPGSYGQYFQDNTSNKESIHNLLYILKKDILDQESRSVELFQLLSQPNNLLETPYKENAVNLVFSLISKYRLTFSDLFQNISDQPSIESLIISLSEKLKQQPDTEIHFPIKTIEQWFESENKNFIESLIYMLSLSKQKEVVQLLSRKLCQLESHKTPIAKSLGAILGRTYD